MTLVRSSFVSGGIASKTSWLLTNRTDHFLSFLPLYCLLFLFLSPILGNQELLGKFPFPSFVKPFLFAFFCDANSVRPTVLLARD